MSQMTALPSLSLQIASADVEAEVLQSLVDVRVCRRLSLPTQCELSFVDPPPDFDEILAVSVGCSLRVVLDDAGCLFEGEVTAVEQDYAAAATRTVRIRGYDALQHLRRRQPVCNHVPGSLAVLAAELLADLNLAVEFPEEPPRWRRLIQHRQSDFDLLVQLADEAGLYLVLRGGVVQFVSLAGQGAAVPLRLGDALLEVHFDHNSDAVQHEVTVVGWDPGRVEVRSGSASRPRVSAAVYDSFLGSESGAVAQRTIADVTLADATHAEQLAQAELDRRAAHKIVAWGVTEGSLDLWPGGRVSLSGVSPALSGEYVLTRVIHQINRRTGFVAEFSTRPPPAVERRRDATVTWGSVSRIDDPDSQGRVCVTLPACGGVETDWMGVVMPGAGSGKGLMTLADVGDQVLVVFPNGDLRHGVVIGGLYGSQSPLDRSGIENGAVRRFSLQTPGGQRVQLDDTAGSVRLENADGSSLELLPAHARLHSTADLILDAPGRNIFIRAANIHFERK